MQTLRTFGHYNIVSEKIDLCPCKYNDEISMLIIATIFLPAIFCIMAASFGNTTYTLAFLLIGGIGAISGYFILDSTFGCGTKIILKDNNHNNCEVKTFLYQFTDNPDADASEIKKIMDDFENYANEIDITDKKRKLEKSKSAKECCDKYKSVIQKVK